MSFTEQVRYEELVAGFRALVQHAVRPAATIAVVSKGDHDLLALGDRRAWHFPQRSDGVYAGYYPSDSANAIAHLEAVRAKGADFIAFPAAALWWLEEYGEFGRHLRSHYREVARDEGGAIYALSHDATAEGDEQSNGADRVAEVGPAGADEQDHAKDGQAEAAAEAAPEPIDDDPRQTRALRPGATARRAVDGYVEKDLLDDLRKVFDPAYYSDQLRADFASADDALAHYLENGCSGTANPHPLFHASWYLKQNPQVRISAQNPLMHFLRNGLADELDPNPYFDTRHYYSQRPHLREEPRNALVHYVENALAKNAAQPNPLFHDSYYLSTYRNVYSEGSTPLEHFLRRGCDQGCSGSPLHNNILKQARSPSSSLTRGKWRSGTVLFFTSGERRKGRPAVAAVAGRLGEEYHVGSLVIAYRTPGDDVGAGGAAPSIVLEDYELAAEIFRASALRLLARSLAVLRPRFAVSDVTEVLEPLSGKGVETLYMLPEADVLPAESTLEEAFENAGRVLVPSSAAFLAACDRLGRHPTNVTLSPFPGPSPGIDDDRRSSTTAAYTRALVDLATSDLGVQLPATGPARRARPRGRPRILIPCSDWAVSGVNASLEAVGRELIELGWDLEIVFTRAKQMVLETAEGERGLPSLPYRYLRRDKTGVPGMWEALIADVESNAPCILFMGYDFLGNSVAPALTENVGVVAWAQADDADYYEQAYRLGLYCNAVVCVSERIKDKVSALNPAIGERAQVIHNSSVWRKDLTSRRAPKGSMMRLVYCGRLVQYQKRVLDFLDLAHALDRAGVPYEISLIGTFSREQEKEAFERDGRFHLQDGRMKLLGRMGRDAILEELTGHDFFVLLSDFEGLPVSLVEAMARGCVPVVAESPSGIPELISIGEDGLIVSGRDYDEWAKLLAGLWQDRRRHSLMSRRARAKVRDRFTVEHIGKQFHELFHRIAEELAAGAYRRPPALHWGEHRSEAGDVLPPPNMHRPALFQWAGLH